MRKQLSITHAAYYKWLHRITPEQELEKLKLAEIIKESMNVSYKALDIVVWRYGLITLII